MADKVFTDGPEYVSDDFGKTWMPVVEGVIIHAGPWMVVNRIDFVSKSIYISPKTEAKG